MSRSVKDLRELICISRLTIRESDDEILSSGDEKLGTRCPSRISSSLSSFALEGSDRHQKSVPDKSLMMSTPDSGFITNGNPGSDSQNSDSESNPSLLHPLETYHGGSNSISGGSFSTNSSSAKTKKKKSKTRPPPTEQPASSDQCAVPKVASRAMKSELLSVSHRRIDTRAIGDRSSTPSSDFADGRFEKLLMYVDGGVISEWLEKSNKNVAELTAWCHDGDSFVQFSHFWLSEFNDRQKFEILELEYTILLDHLSLAYAAGLNSGEIQKRHLSIFLNSVFCEYPAKLMSSQGAFLFLDYLDILSSSKQLPYRKLLSDVRCSTRTAQHIQWILSTRSFAVVSVWSAVVNFYRKLISNSIGRPATASTPKISYENDLHQNRILKAISYGYADVVHYLLKSGKVLTDWCDTQQKSLVFHAVICKQPKILHLLLSKASCKVNGNRPAINGNTPLHAAVSTGNEELLEVLLASGAIDVNACNSHCDGATPLHLAVLEGNLPMVRLLLRAGANPALKMGTMSAVDLAKEFGQGNVLEYLLEGEAV